MVALPFLYFGFLALRFYRKSRRIDLAVYIALIYAVSGLFSILVDAFGLRSADTLNYQISLVASLVYCFSISLFLFPIHKYSKYYFSGVKPLSSDKALRTIAIVGFLYSIFYIVMSLGSLRFALTSDISELRGDLYSGMVEVGWVGSLPAIIRMPVSLLNHAVGSAWVFQLLAFYALFVQRMPKKYGYMLFTISLLSPLSGIIGVDRSNATYWVLSLIGCYFFFKPFVGDKDRKGIINYGLVLLGLVLAYLWVVTDSRFGESGIYDDSTTSIVDYLGKPFINFCYFYDDFTSPNRYSGILFPFLSNVFGSDSYSVIYWQERLSDLTGISVGTFYTFLGAIKIALGKIGMYAYVIVVSVLGSVLIKPNQSYTITLYKLYVFFLLSSVPMLGLFGHYYSGSVKSFCAALFFIITLLLSRRVSR